MQLIKPAITLPDASLEYRMICATNNDEYIFYCVNLGGGAGYEIKYVMQTEDFLIEHSAIAGALPIQILNVDSYNEDAYLWYYSQTLVQIFCISIGPGGAGPPTPCPNVWSTAWGMVYFTSLAIGDGRFILYRYFDDGAGVLISDPAVVIYDYHLNAIIDIDMPDTPTPYYTDKGSSWQTPVRINDKIYFMVNAFTAGATGYQMGNYYMLVGRLYPNLELKLSWEKFVINGELTSAQKEFKKIFRFHVMNKNSVTYLWLGVAVEDYGGSTMDFIDYILFQDQRTGIWCVLSEQPAVSYPMRIALSHRCSAYQHGVFGYFTYQAFGVLGQKSVNLVTNKNGVFSGQKFQDNASHLTTANQYDKDGYTPTAFLVYNTGTTAYDLYYQDLELLDEPPCPNGLREGKVWGAYDFILWSHFNWNLSAVYWDIQILDPVASRQVLTVNDVGGVTTTFDVVDSSPFTVGDRITIDGALCLDAGAIVPMTELNDFQGTITAVDVFGVDVEVALDSSGFRAYAGGGYIDKLYVSKRLGDGVNPVQTYYRVESEDGLSTGTYYSWRCRVVGADGTVSAWSGAGSYLNAMIECVDAPDVATPITDTYDTQRPYVNLSISEYRSPIIEITTVVELSGGAEVFRQTQTGSSARVQEGQYRIRLAKNNGLLTATAYTVYVIVTNLDGFSATSLDSAPFTLTFASPAAPTALSVLDAGGYIKIEFTKTALVDDYLIVRDGEIIGDVTLDGAGIFYDVDCLIDTLYTYDIYACNSVASSAALSGTGVVLTNQQFALVEKTDGVRKPVAELFLSDTAGYNPSQSNNPESVGPIKVPTYKTVECSVKFPTHDLKALQQRQNSTYIFKNYDGNQEYILTNVSPQYSEQFDDGTKIVFVNVTMSGEGEDDTI